MDPSYQPSLVHKNSGSSGALPFAGSDLVLSPSQWSRHVVGAKCVNVDCTGWVLALFLIWDLYILRCHTL